MQPWRMALSDFIRAQCEGLVDEWAEFARTQLEAARGLSEPEVRDHAKLLLQRIADEMDMPQSAQHRHARSRGERPQHAPQVTEMARKDADQRFRQGFSMAEMVAEYRALRASVVRRWKAQGAVDGHDSLDELIRFNDSMDQALSEAIGWYGDRVKEARNLMLGVLGHDLRNPLGAAHNSAQYLLRAGGLNGAQTKATVRIQASMQRMREMVDDLLDFTRTRLGAGLAVIPEPAHLGNICRDAVDELEAFHPDRELRVETAGDLRGEWDRRRIAQLVSNLAANAIQHGEPGTPVTVGVLGEGGGVRIQVRNQGPPIAPEAQRTLFDPLMRPVVQEAERREGSSGLGLGLYIVREIAQAHQGSVAVESSVQDGTVFTVDLPRRAVASASAAPAAFGG